MKKFLTLLFFAVGVAASLGAADYAYNLDDAIGASVLTLRKRAKGHPAVFVDSFKAAEGDEAIAAYIRAEFESRLSDCKEVGLVTRNSEAFEKIVAEKAVEQSGYFADPAEIMTLINADVIVSGEFSRAKGVFYLAVKIYDMKGKMAARQFEFSRLPRGF